jgi:hypothetical protein
MKIFRAMSFPRWVILLMAISSSVLAYFVYERTQRLELVQSQLRTGVPTLAREVQMLAMELDDLQDRADKENLKGEAKPEYYIQSIAHSDVTRIGEVNVTPQRPKSYKGFEDHTYTIKPVDKNAEFFRNQIGNFLYKLEADSRKVQVTKIDLKPTSPVKLGEIGPDTWTFTVELTSRQASGS